MSSLSDIHFSFNEVKFIVYTNSAPMLYKGLFTSIDELAEVLVDELVVRHALLDHDPVLVVLLVVQFP